jgi:hypothetical protein
VRTRSSASSFAFRAGRNIDRFDLPDLMGVPSDYYLQADMRLGARRSLASIDKEIATDAADFDFWEATAASILKALAVRMSAFPGILVIGPLLKHTSLIFGFCLRPMRLCRRFYVI